MRRFHQLSLPLLATAALLAGCVDRDPVAPVTAGAPVLTRDLPDAGQRAITVLSRNVYLGADIDPVLAAPPEQIPFVVAAGWQTVLASNFAERAQALIDEIEQTRPHLIGLQEVAVYMVQPNGDAAFGGTVPATTIALDFLPILMQAILARGLDYRYITLAPYGDVEVPMFTGGSPNPFTDLRLIQRNVILARGDVQTSNPMQGSFAAFVPLPIGGQTVPLRRSWTSVDATVAGTSFRFINTHLEIQRFAPIQVAQAQQLIAMADAAPLPVILVGDLNSAADGSQTQTYALLRSAGFADVWERGRPHDPGYTCCQAADLRNAESALDQRLDLVLIRGFAPLLAATSAAGYHVRLVGAHPDDRTSSGLWPSDHAGVAATLRLPALASH
jgi:hypothetical protein